MQKTPKLIVIRGPSGSGKSTVANELLKRAERSTLLIGEDKIRKMFSDHTRTGHAEARQLAIQSVLFGLACGYDLIYHGILTVQGNSSQFDEILMAHPNENYFFYLDVSFDETVRRHDTRHKKSQFGADAMRRWWEYSSPTGSESETIIPETSSLEQTLQTIARTTGIKLASE